MLAYKSAVLCFILSLPLAALSYTCERAQTVGWQERPPYLRHGIQGDVMGIDARIVKLIFQGLNCSVKFIHTDWHDQLNQLKLGKLDFVLSAFKTQQRAQYADFTSAYRQEKIVLLVHGRAQHSQHKMMSSLLANNFKVGIVYGYYYGEDFEKIMLNTTLRSTIIPVKSPEDNIQQFARHKVDGILSDPFVAVYLSRRLGLTPKIFQLYPLAVHADDVHLMASKKTVSPRLVQAINQQIEHLKDKGVIRKILEKYSFKLY